MHREGEPFYVVVNRRCNNNCMFCMETNIKNIYIPAQGELFRLLQKARVKTESLVFTGPEPTVNKRLPEYVKIARNLGYKSIHLVTNARALCYFAYAQKLLKNGVTSFNISLHGSRKSVHDVLTRMPGSFEETVRACQNLSVLKLRYSFRWHVNCTLTTINEPDLYDFIKLALSFKGIGGIIINIMIPRGRAEIFFKELLTSYTDSVNAFKRAIDRLDISTGKKNFEMPDIRLHGIPPCLMEGYRQYVSKNKPILVKSGRRIVRNKEGTTYRRVKNERCKKCKYFIQCPGVPWQYIKRKGWEEFQPVF